MLLKKCKLLLPSILAGMAIGIGGTVFLSLESKLAGALLFTAGLYTICVHGLNLFTGKVGYLVLNPADYLLDLAVIWIGNWIGTGLTALGIRVSRVGGSLSEKAASMTGIKLSDSFVSLFALGIFCGMLMYIAVEGYKRCQNPLILFVCVAAFILAGFEHCIADMFYFWLAGCSPVSALPQLLVITLGNSVGGCLLPLVGKMK